VAGSRDTKKLRLGCMNIDPHLDVRKPSPLVTSGSPFYLAIESGVLHPSRFIEFGIQSHCNAPALWDYVGKKKIEIIPFEKLRGGNAVAAFQQALKRLSAKCDVIVLSMDLDAAAQAYAPGVSAPQAEGFTPSDLIQFAEIAGKNKKVVSLGLFELNPAHDIDDRTARVGATVAWHFIEYALARK
jgi:formiminoglutamase